jgi:hypothetical protein
MGRILVVVLGLGAVLFAAYSHLAQDGSGRIGQELERPTQQLDNVRQAADRIERDAQERSDELLDRTAR